MGRTADATTVPSGSTASRMSGAELDALPSTRITPGSPVCPSRRTKASDRAKPSADTRVMFADSSGVPSPAPQPVMSCVRYRLAFMVSSEV